MARMTVASFSRFAWMLALAWGCSDGTGELASVEEPSMVLATFRGDLVVGGDNEVLIDSQWNISFFWRQRGSKFSEPMDPPSGTTCSVRVTPMAPPGLRLPGAQSCIDKDSSEAWCILGLRQSRPDGKLGFPRVQNPSSIVLQIQFSCEGESDRFDSVIRARGAVH